MSVGGTTLSLDSSGRLISETAWSGSGGGVSDYEPRPSYQYYWQDAWWGRATPDVSYDADPNTGVSVYVSNYYGYTGWYTVGGTSAGAPQWAALFAIVNAGRSYPLSSSDVALYSLGKANYHWYYRDVIYGCDGGYCSTSGYDYVTGLGSPLAHHLIPSLRSY